MEAAVFGLGTHVPQRAAQTFGGRDVYHHLWLLHSNDHSKYCTCPSHVPIQI